MQNFGVTNKKHYGMLWDFLEWSIAGMGHLISEPQFKIPTPPPPC